MCGFSQKSQNFENNPVIIVLVLMLNKYEEHIDDVDIELKVNSKTF